MRPLTPYRTPNRYSHHAACMSESRGLVEGITHPLQYNVLGITHPFRNWTVCIFREEEGMVYSPTRRRKKSAFSCIAICPSSPEGM